MTHLGRFFGAAVVVGALAFGGAQAQDAASNPEMSVYKSPTCGCCGGWIDHMKAAGFTVTAHDVVEMEMVKDLMGVPAKLGSCHTAMVDGYLIEGHVPADAVRRLLAERPDAAGLAVPGMPMGSPGMETADGRVEPYAALLFDRHGDTQPFMHFGN